MPINLNPFAHTDFATGGNLSASPGPGANLPGVGGNPYGPPDVDPADWAALYAGTQSQPPPVPTSPTMPPPDISLGEDPEQQYEKAKRYFNNLIANPRTYEDAAGKLVEDPTWANQVAAAQGYVNMALTAYKDDVTYKRKQTENAQAKAEAQGNAAISRANSMALAQLNHQLALLEQEQAHQDKLAEQLQQQGFTKEERLGGQEFVTQERMGTQEFMGEQNALDREVQRIQNEIAQGNLDLNTALGQLQEFMKAMPFTLPKGAQYVPGFQPGGGVQEASRLAGVGYNPANYKANTVPYDVSTMVQQTMGR